MLELILVAALVLAIPVLFLSLVRHTYSHEVAEDLVEWAKQKLGRDPLATTWYVLAAGLGLVVLVVALNNLRGPDGAALVFLLVALGVLGLFVHTWRREFLFLMGRRDDEFPGRFDKLTWALLLMLLAPVGLWVFHAYRVARWPEPKAERIVGEGAAELS